MDDELERLQRELEQVQEEKTNPLSQRTVAQIMLKLHHKGLQFYLTVDGNEFVTPRKLQSQTNQLLKERGKIPLPLLPQLLNVNQQVLPLHTATLHNNNLFSTDYFTQVIESIRQELAISGSSDLTEVAVRHELTLPFLVQLVTPHIHIFDAQLTQNTLSTQQYSLLLMAKTAGFLTALSLPTHIDAACKILKADKGHVSECIQKLIVSHRLKGVIRNQYYVPDKFIHNQKNVVKQFYGANGYLSQTMLEKQFLVERPKIWIQKNIEGEYVWLEGVCFSLAKINEYTLSMKALLKEGYFEVTAVVPFLSEEGVTKLLSEHCELEDVTFAAGYCFHNSWIDKTADQFKEKVIHAIYFNNKNKKELSITEEDLVQTIFSCNLAEYSTAKMIASPLLPLLLERLKNMKKNIERDLSQNKGCLNGNFLKYRSCRTILRSQNALTNALAGAQKIIKKNQVWKDPHFGPIPNDPKGLYSIVYYDEVTPKGWPKLQSLEWKIYEQQIKIQQKINQSRQVKDTAQKPQHYLSRNLLSSLMEIFDYFCASKKINRFRSDPKHKQSNLLVFQFSIDEKERRYVMIDTLLPFLDGECFFSVGPYALVQKAHAKLRYCYRATLGVGITQLIMELTGLTAKKVAFPQAKSALAKEQCVVVLAEGPEGIPVTYEGKHSGVLTGKPYLLKPDSSLFPLIQESLTEEAICEVFKNMYVIG